MTYWSFTETGDAYDACQCNEDIKTGDTLVIREAGYRGKCIGRDDDGFRKYEHEDKPIDIAVVALAWAWPIAVTIAEGQLHAIEDDEGAYDRVILDAGFTYAQIRTAVDKANELGAPVRAPFTAWLAEHEPKRRAKPDSLEGQNHYWYVEPSFGLGAIRRRGDDERITGFIEGSAAFAIAKAHNDAVGALEDVCIEHEQARGWEACV